MPLFLDTHRNVAGLTAAAVTVGHARDIEVQARHGVRFVRYWYDEATGKIFCLAEAPNMEAIISAHREAHGMLADEITEVQEGH
jgi:hypothetical protein